MDKKYYRNNMLWSITILVIDIFILWKDISNHYLDLAFFIVNTLLFPFAKFTVENIFLKYFLRIFKTEIFLKSNIAKYRLYALCYFFYFIFAIPFTLFFIIYWYFIKQVTK